MAVDATSPLKIYLFSGAGTYGVTFKVLEAAHIQAQLIRTDGTIVGLVNGTDYSVTILPAGAGANVVVTTEAYAAGGTIEIRRVIPVTQATSWANGGSLDMPLLTQVFDKLTMILQQMQVYMEGEAAKSFWKGDWTTGTSYLVNDIVELASTGDWYRCLTTHTSGTWATDLAAGKWVLYLAIGEVITAAATATGAADTAVGAAAAAAEDAAEAAASAASAVNAPGTSATSTTSLAIGTGEKTLTVQTGKDFVVGMAVMIASTVSPTNWMHGIVTSYTSGTGALVVSVDAIGGSGTLANWTISLSGPIIASLGMEQTWQNFDAIARPLNTTHQNDTDLPIQVVVSLKSSAGPGTSSIKVNDTSTFSFNVAEINMPAGIGFSIPYSVIVPPWHYYRVDATSGLTWGQWAELRQV